MHILHVYCQVKPEHVDAFKDATNDNAANSRKEPGVARFDVLQQTDDPTRFVLMEAYYTADAHANHKETAHYDTWVAKTADWFVAPRTRAIFSNISPADQDW